MGGEISFGNPPVNKYIRIADCNLVLYHAVESSLRIVMTSVRSRLAAFDMVIKQSHFVKFS